MFRRNFAFFFAAAAGGSGKSGSGVGGINNGSSSHHNNNAYSHPPSHFSSSASASPSPPTPPSPSSFSSDNNKDHQQQQQKAPPLRWSATMPEFMPAKPGESRYGYVKAYDHQKGFGFIAEEITSEGDELSSSLPPPPPQSSKQVGLKRGKKRFKNYFFHFRDLIAHENAAIGKVLGKNGKTGVELYTRVMFEAKAVEGAEGGGGGGGGEVKRDHRGRELKSAVAINVRSVDGSPLPPYTPENLKKHLIGAVVTDKFQGHQK